MAQIETVEQAIQVLDTFEFFMDGGVRRNPDPADFKAAMALLKSHLGYVETPRFPIMTKARKRFGREYPAQETGFFAEVVKNTSIRLTGTHSGRAVDITFKLGDTAEYDSFNLRYLGKIVQISEKRIVVQPNYGDTRKSMDLYSFAWRNHNFNLEDAIAENAETSQYI